MKLFSHIVQFSHQVDNTTLGVGWAMLVATSALPSDHSKTGPCLDSSTQFRDDDQLAALQPMMPPSNSSVFTLQSLIDRLLQS